MVRPLLSSNLIASVIGKRKAAKLVLSVHLVIYTVQFDIDWACNGGRANMQRLFSSCSIELRRPRSLATANRHLRLSSVLLLSLLLLYERLRSLSDLCLHSSRRMCHHHATTVRRTRPTHDKLPRDPSINTSPRCDTGASYTDRSIIKQLPRRRRLTSAAVVFDSIG